MQERRGHSSTDEPVRSAPQQRVVAADAPSAAEYMGVWR